jgi:hypothetical protein
MFVASLFGIVSYLLAATFPQNMSDYATEPLSAGRFCCGTIEEVGFVA